MKRVSAEQLSELIDFAPDTIRKWARAGRIPGEKLNEAWRFVHADVVKALKNKAKSKAKVK